LESWLDGWGGRDPSVVAWVVSLSVASVDVVVLVRVDEGERVVVEVYLTNRDSVSSQVANGCGFDGSNSNRPSPVSQQPGEWSQQKEVSVPVTLEQEGMYVKAGTVHVG
jgi:hypothetical protein